MAIILPTQPMGAGKIHHEDQLQELKWPVLVSPKLDGIRCLIHPTLGPVSRSFLPIPNAHIRAMLWRYYHTSHLDGELVTLNSDGTHKLFNDIQSGVMSQSGEPKFKYYVFDCFISEDTFQVRHRIAMMKVQRDPRKLLRIVPHQVVRGFTELLDAYERFLEEGFEGICIRAMDGPYKSGRSTYRQGWLLKYKPVSSSEGLVIGFKELLRNKNPDERNIFGHAKRSSHKENMIPAGTLGALLLDTQWGEVSCGSGLNDAIREEIWNDQDEYMGRKVSFTFQTQGMQELPRFPIFKGFRND